MSYGPSNTVKTAENNLGGISNTALNQQLPMFNQAGGGMLSLGNQNTQTGTNFFNTLLNGNQANTQAMLQPQINAARQNQATTLGAINTLMPRTGGRFATLFGQSFAPQQQIQNLFNNEQVTGAQTLPQIGLQQSGIGTNLYGLGNGALSAATGANNTLASTGMQQQQMSNNLWSGLGSGLLGLATLPLGGPNTLLGSLFGSGSGGVKNMSGLTAYGLGV